MMRTAPLDCQPSALTWIEQRLGLHFPPEREPELARLLTEAAAEAGFALYANGAEPASLRTPPASLSQALVRRLTIGETYFFREPATLAAFEHHILPELVRRRARGHRRLRLWSAGCCTGEEAYSLAMILERALPDIDDWDVHILATDLNHSFLERARRGVYTEWSFRQIAPATKARFFTEIEPGIYAIHPRIRARVAFAPLNLATDAYPSAIHDTGRMDLILCRNVLMYFSERQARAAMIRLHRSLADSGWLAVSPTEHALRHVPGFRSIGIGGAFLYRKTCDNEAPAPARVPPAPLVVPSSPPAPPRRPLASRPLEPVPPPASVAPAPADPAALAQAAADRGQLPSALRSCDEALATDRMNPALHGLRARILEESGRVQEAEDALRRVLYLDPVSLHAHFALGNLASRRGDSTQARRAFARLLALLRSVPADTVLPDMEGLTAGRLSEIVRALDRGLV